MQHRETDQCPSDLEDLNQHLQRIRKAEEIKNGEQLIGMRFYYRAWGTLEGVYHWRSRARVVMIQKETKTILPSLLGKKDDWQPRFIDARDPGWVYQERF